MFDKIKVGTILENSVREFTKVLVVKDGMFGITGWSNLKNTKESKVVVTYVNAYGLESAEVKIVGKGDDKAPANAPAEADAKPTKSSLTKLSVDEVKKLATELNLDSEGNKDDVLARLFTHYGLDA